MFGIQDGIGITPKKEEFRRERIHEANGMTVKLMDARFKITDIELNIFHTYVFGKHRDGTPVLLFQCEKGLEKELIEKINELKVDTDF